MRCWTNAALAPLYLPSPCFFPVALRIFLLFKSGSELFAIRSSGHCDGVYHHVLLRGWHGKVGHLRKDVQYLSALHVLSLAESPIRTLEDTELGCTILLLDVTTVLGSGGWAGSGTNAECCLHDSRSPSVSREDWSCLTPMPRLCTTPYGSHCGWFGDNSEVAPQVRAMLHQVTIQNRRGLSHQDTISLNVTYESLNIHLTQTNDGRMRSFLSLPIYHFDNIASPCQDVSPIALSLPLFLPLPPCLYLAPECDMIMLSS